MNMCSVLRGKGGEEVRIGIHSYYTGRRNETKQNTEAEPPLPSVYLVSRASHIFYFQLEE